MLRRLMGLLLVIRALAPALIVIIVAVGFGVILADLRAATAAPIRGINTAMGEMGTALETVKTDLDAALAEISDLAALFQGFTLPNLIPDIPNNIRIPSLNLPDITVPVPTNAVITTSTVNIGVNITYPSGVRFTTTNLTLVVPDLPNVDIPVPGLGALDTALRNALAPLTNIFDALDTAFDSIGALTTTLRTLPDSVQAIVDDGELLLNSIDRVLANWAGTLATVALILLILVIIYFAAPALDDLRRGLRMLRGLAAE